MKTYVSPLACLVNNPRRTRMQDIVKQVCVHITGRSTWLNAAKRKQHPLARLRDIVFNNPKVDATSTYSIDPWGEIWQHHLESQQPWAQGLSRAERSRQAAPRWWLEHWADVDCNVGLLEVEYFELVSKSHPLELIANRRSPNYNSVSIECVQWGNQYLLTLAQYRALSALVADICKRHGLSKCPLNVVGHEDVNPWARGDAGGGWDPGARRDKPRFCWDTALTLADQEDEHQVEILAELVNQQLAITTPPRPAWMPAALS